jgi:hypothetical protein
MSVANTTLTTLIAIARKSGLATGAAHMGGLPYEGL